MVHSQAGQRRIGLIQMDDGRWGLYNKGQHGCSLGLVIGVVVRCFSKACRTTSRWPEIMSNTHAKVLPSEQPNGWLSSLVSTPLEGESMSYCKWLVVWRERKSMYPGGGSSSFPVHWFWYPMRLRYGGDAILTAS